MTEYLAQLGVTNGSFPRNPLVVKRQADDTDPDLSDLIYAKVDEFTGGPSLYNSAPREHTKYFLPTTVCTSAGSGCYQCVSVCRKAAELSAALGHSLATKPGQVVAETFYLIYPFHFIAS